MISLVDLDQLIHEIRAGYDPHTEPFFYVSPEMKHRIDVVISQKPHQRLLRKCQYRRIYRRRKRGKR